MDLLLGILHLCFSSWCKNANFSKETTQKINVENFFIEYGLQAINAKEYIHDFEIQIQKQKNLIL